MAWPIIVGPIIDLIGSTVSSYAENKKIKLQNKNLLEQVKQNRLTKAQDDDSEWEKIQAEGAQNSWKDEYLTIVFTIPAILAFIPSMVPIVEAGFDALEATPIWYQSILAVIVSSSFGVKIWKIKKNGFK